MAEALSNKAEVLQELREAIHKYGQEAGPKLVREKYPEISKPTWYRYLNQVAASPMEVAASKARGAARHLPAAPAPEYIAAKPVEARQNIDMLSRLESLYADAELLRAYSMTRDVDGNEKIKIPTFFSQSIKLRADLLDNALRAMAQVWDLQRMQKLHDLIIEEVGKADPETQKRITAALKDLDARVGITMEARL
jgi:hypothetical protein